LTEEQLNQILNIFESQLTSSQRKIFLFIADRLENKSQAEMELMVQQMRNMSPDKLFNSGMGMSSFLGQNFGAKSGEDPQVNRDMFNQSLSALNTMPPKTVVKLLQKMVKRIKK